MGIILVTDFGSTYTKVLAIDADSETLIGRAQSLTTVDTDITIGMHRAFADLYSTCKIEEGDVVRKFAGSSAAGGLKLAAIGLVPALTLEAARRAALGAGVKVEWSSGFDLDPARMRIWNPCVPILSCCAAGRTEAIRRSFFTMRECWRPRPCRRRS